MITNAQTANLSLSDGTPVDFVKITSKDRIQVRVPADHPLAKQDDGGADPTLRIFTREGTHFKNRTALTLVPAAAPAAPATTAAGGSYEVNGAFFASLSDARQEAVDLFRETGENVTIYQTTRTAIGTVGFVSAAI